MGTQERQPDVDLEDLADDQDALKTKQGIEELAGVARQANVYRLLYLIERHYPDAPPLGHLGPSVDEAVRISVSPSLGFAASDVEQLAWKATSTRRSGRADVMVNFLGLLGAGSPLPSYFAEEVTRRTRRDDATPLRGLLDVVHHRLVSLLYRNWAKVRLGVTFQKGGTDKLTKRLFCAVGHDGFAGTTPTLSPFQLLRFAPLLALRSRSAGGLETVLTELFPNVGIEIEQFVGHWTRIDRPLRNKLGVQNHRLGSNMVLGRYVYDGGGRFCIKLGPLNYDDYLSYLPGGHRRPLLKAVVNTFSPGTHDVVLELNVNLDEAPRFQLGSPRSATLKRTAWLGGTSARTFSLRVPLDERPEAETDDDSEDELEDRQARPPVYI